MADYKVTDTELTSIANAIRAKTGKSAQMEFPTEFVSEIGSISGGGTIDLLPESDKSKIINDIVAQNTFRSSGIVCSLDSNNSDVTCYIVCRSTGNTGGYPRIVSILYSSNTGNEPSIYTNGGAVGWTTYNSDEVIPGISELDTNLYVLAIDNTTKKAKVFVNGIKIGEKTFNNSGATVTFSKDTLYRYMISMYGVVKECESDTVIIANSEVIMDYFNIS